MNSHPKMNQRHNDQAKPRRNDGSEIKPKPNTGVGSSDLLDSVEWKIEHRSDGVSFIASPWKRGDRIEYAWMGPYERHVAEWLFDAVKRKQANVQAEPRRNDGSEIKPGSNSGVGSSDLVSCPAGHPEGQLERDYSIGDYVIGPWRVRCRCGWTGPRMATSEEAAKAWTTRAANH